MKPNTMGCKWCRERMQAFARNRLSEADRREFEEHAALCPACREELAQEQALERLLNTWEAPEPSPDFETPVVAGLAEDREVHAWWRNFIPARPWQWVLVAGALLLLVIGVLGVSRLRVPDTWLGAPRMELILAQDRELLQELELLEILDVLETWQPAAPGEASDGDAS